jgi:hypothetical protein|tara:strand:+ start:643 stop:813 length:171 start_codon:yes stop_codon:yes gene_type:complete
MKTFEFLISESCATKFDIVAKTEEQAREIFLKKGLPDDIDREFIDYQIETIEEIKE